jgi:hemerythrin
VSSLVFDATTMTSGAESVDDQHRVLFDLINRLVADMQAGKANEDIGMILDELAKYAVTHFAHEESCMARFSCPAAAANKVAHAEFVRTLTGLKADFDRHGPTSTLAIRMQQVLARWITGHILGIDIRLRPCIPAGTRA